MHCSTDKPDDGSIVYNRVRNSFKNFQLVTGKDKEFV